MVLDKMIVGSGMIASAFARGRGIKGAIVHAAGVSDSTCARQSEFDRDKDRLAESLQRNGMFIYVSTCSVERKPYTLHKQMMEDMVRSRGNYLIVRLPIVAGPTPNPHTLLNFLYARISRSEGFDLFTRAHRNVIDVADVVSITEWLIRDGAFNEAVNVASPRDYPIDDIVREFESITGKHAFANRIDSGDTQYIDTHRIAGCDVDFSGDYLSRTLRRYYK